MKVELTWTFNGVTKKEICNLADYDTLLVTSDGQVLPQEASDEILREGFVVFEDKDGQFCLQMKQIKHIKVLE